MEENTGNKARDNNLKFRKVVYYILGIIEALFAFRLIFKILGANPENTFISIIYNITGVFLAPFSSIFRTAVTKGIETKSILEPATLIAMVVYALIAYGIVKLVKIYQAPKDKEIE